MASRLGYASPSGHGYTGCRTDIATGTTNGGRSEGPAVQRALHHAYARLGLTTAEGVSGVVVSPEGLPSMRLMMSCSSAEPVLGGVVVDVPRADIAAAGWMANESERH